MRKYALFIVAAALLFTACKKKKDTTNCYVCIGNIALTSTFSSLDNANYAHDTVVICNYDDGRANIYMQEHTHVDTFSHVGDTLTLSHYTMSCTVQ